MKRRIGLLTLLAAVWAPAAQAQFELFRVNGNVEVAVPSIYDFGPIYAGETAVTSFRLRNAASSPAVLAILNAAGAGFTLAGPGVPFSVAPGAAVDFTVSFSAARIGSYSANLEVTGLSVLLTASVAPSLTYTVSLPSGQRQLGAGATDFGTAGSGSTVMLHFTATNQTSVPLIVPAISVAGPYFSLTGASPSGSVLQPQQQAGFDVQFAPAAAGTFTGNLTIGDRTYSLSGTAPAPVLPNPRLSVSLPLAQSGQQGSLTVAFDGPAAASGSGTVTLDFQPAATVGNDSAVAFASGGRSVSFTYAAGDTQGRFGTQSAAMFQTGTTAGTLVFTASLGNSTAHQTFTVPPAIVAITAVEATRGSGSLTVQVIGFDNTQSVGPLSFTFFDATGNIIPPGGISSDGHSDFMNYYSSSDLGGTFVLSARFPVNGDASLVRAVEVQLSNAIGTAQSTRISF